MSIFSRRRSALPLPYAADSPEGLAARWVRWVAGVGPLRNPVSDESGIYSDIHQPDDVWFLAGTFGDEAQRSSTIPAGRPLFFPAFNMWHVDAEGPPPHLSRAWGTATVDGSAVELNTIATPIPFPVAGARLNPVTRSNKPVAMTVWGLWKRLDPLPAGTHTVQFSGGDGYGFSVTVSYHLTVL
jgi:hypothetical protein